MYAGNKARHIRSRYYPKLHYVLIDIFILFIFLFSKTVCVCVYSAKAFSDFFVHFDSFSFVSWFFLKLFYHIWLTKSKCFLFFYLFTAIPFTYNVYPLKSMLLYVVSASSRVVMYESPVNFIFEVLSSFKVISLAVFSLFIVPS